MISWKPEQVLMIDKHGPSPFISTLCVCVWWAFGRAPVILCLLVWLLAFWWTLLPSRTLPAVLFSAIVDDQLLFIRQTHVCVQWSCFPFTTAAQQATDTQNFPCQNVFCQRFLLIITKTGVIWSWNYWHLFLSSFRIQFLCPSDSLCACVRQIVCVWIGFGWSFKILNGKSPCAEDSLAALTFP